MSAITAADLLKAAKKNSFVVYKSQAKEEYVISVRYILLFYTAGPPRGKLRMVRDNALEHEKRLHA